MARRTLVLRTIVLLAVVGVTAVAVVTMPGGHTTAPTTTVAGTVASPAAQAASLETTSAYRKLVVDAATDFDVAVTNLDHALAARDRTAAIAAWRRATTAFLRFRPELDGGPAAWGALDGPVTASGDGGGLHAVEYGLFHGPLLVATNAMANLTLAGATYAVGLFRAIEQPSTVAIHGVEDLGYLVTACLAGDPEPWSGDRALAVEAVGHGALATAAALEPLAAVVVPADAGLLARSMGALRRALDAGASTPSSTLEVARAARALQSVLGELAGAFAGYTNGRYYA